MQPPSVTDNPTGTVFDIQRYSIHDGPGIRTIVFLKGCPLTCRWCSNPESQNARPELFYAALRCVHCGHCVHACPHGAIAAESPHVIDRSFCQRCAEAGQFGQCAKACLTGALSVRGKSMTVPKVMDTLRRDATHYRRSGGGITLSGGEPLAQPHFALRLLQACGGEGWHTAMETTGLAAPEVIDTVMPALDLALLDIKSLNSEKHQQHTGVPCERILDNAQRIAALTTVEVRVPLIPGFNDSAADVQDIALFARSLPGVETLHLLPYHSYGENKYGLLGRTYPMTATTTLSESSLQMLHTVVENAGLNCVMGG